MALRIKDGLAQAIEAETAAALPAYSLGYATLFAVPYTAYRQKVTVRATSTSIEILDANRVRIASHARRHSGTRYQTDPAHMPDHHRHYWDSQQFNGSRYRAWAETVGEDTLYVIDRMLTAHTIEEQAYKSCMGLLQMAKKYNPERLEAACSKARLLQSCTYTTVANILKNGQDLIKPSPSPPEGTVPEHENIRGAAYYV